MNLGEVIMQTLWVKFKRNLHNSTKISLKIRFSIHCQASEQYNESGERRS